MKRFQQYLKYIWSNKNYRISLYLGAVILVWLASGMVLPSAEDEPQTQVVATEPEPILVQARYIDAQNYQPELRIRAFTQAHRSVSLRSELSGKVVALPAVEGQPVAKGDVLCELALDDRQVRLLEAQSAVDQAQLEYDGSLRLKSGGYQSATAIAGAKARLDSAKAELLRSQLDMENTRIRAPFAGVIDRYAVEVGDYMDRGDECGVLLELDPMIIRGQVSETQVGHLRKGDKAFGQLLTGQKVTGEVSLVGYGSDSKTRTFPVEVTVDNRDLTLRSGITTELIVPTAAIAAHKIPSSLLTLVDNGKVGVRILSEDHRVQLVEVELIGDSDGAIWVSGLPAHTLLITVGQEYVSQGEKVNVAIEGGSASTEAVGSAGL
ncbi:efflux RND transporter periplasmic adaptor subunit [Aestuariicella sp. G3-2]|uniref:efflux RND transporter periplasmic adaptor subunit n=1 Tax=Pseudomaricurvus albidus TaxID=2842452 RepID=UPI001C0AB2BB|nr:efflux RND transporter periplasmic adaptor subunit [Aestuariicella albida]MBU3070967.1 efflux RND transporter periplasmic adaptor subunit [Aestuariicella albida]